MDYIDPCVSAAEHYTELFGNDDVRLIQMRLPAGERDNEHSHRTETTYFIQGGKARIYVDGDFQEVEIPDGHVLYHGPWTHSVENIGDTEIRAIIFEPQP